MNLFKRIFPALFIFCSLVGIGLVAHLWTQTLLNQTRINLQNARQERQTIATEFEQLQRNLPRIKQDIQDYEMAQQRGVWNAENRLRFSEGLVQLAQNSRLQRLEYGVAPREVFIANSETQKGQWLHSAVEIQFDAPHEGHLLRFIESFPFLPGGIPILQECRVEHAPKALGISLLTANCKGVLYSFVGVGDRATAPGALNHREPKSNAK